MSKVLRLADQLTLPAEAVTETFGILAMRGAGKSNTGAVMAEEMFAAGLPFVVVDPVAHWWGLRSSRDGKGPGLPIPIFGGKHGDVPLEPTSGTMIADLIVDKRLSCVLDLKLFASEGERKRFLLDFAMRIYAKNEDPLHLFLEEADDYIPQKPMREEARLLRAWENIVRRGRGQGLGCTLITQRSAVINKNVLEEVGTLIVLRTTGPRDREAIRGWVKRNELEEELIDSLPGLKNGEAWVWSPHFLGKVQRVQVRRRQTFDSGATPKNVRGDQARRPATLADIDLSKIQKEMQATIERAKQVDPRELRRQVAELQQQLTAARSAAPRKTAPEVRVQEKVRLKVVPGLRKGEIRRVEAMIERLEKTSSRLGRNQVGVAEAAHRLNVALAGVREAEDRLGQTLRATPHGPPIQAPQKPTPFEMPPALRGAVRLLPGKSGPVSPYAMKLLETVAQRRPMRLTRSQVAILSGRSPRSSSFTVALAALVQAGLLEPKDRRFLLTTSGEREVGAGMMLPTTSAADVRETWRRALPDYARALYDVLVRAYPAWMTREELAEKAGRSVTSSSFTVALATLVKNELVDRQDGKVRASDVLFPDV